MARVRKHGKTEEIKTGGDFGLVLVEPRFDLRWDAQLSVRRGGKKRGMLVQAKRRLYGKRWNQFTDMQLIRLPERMNYAALARYEFADVEGRKLDKFKWHILAGLDISEVAEWLRSGKFQNDVNTSELITGLSRGDYGTGDSIVIERDICPDASSYVVVEIDWKDGEDPAPFISRLNQDMAQHKVRQRQKVHILLQ